MLKICLIGAGSTIFAKNIIGDLLLHEEVGEVEVALHDIDKTRLETSRIVAERMIKTTQRPMKLTSTLDRSEAITGSQYVITMMQVGGYKPGTVRDFEIPKLYGLRQTIADTLGIGGIMRAQRTIPVFLEICGDVELLAPDAVVLNYVNPMAMLVWAAARVYPNLKVLGLCHSVQFTIEDLAKDLKIPESNLDYLCAGINHMAFYLKLMEKTDKGLVDVYPRLKELARAGKFPETNKVRYDMLRRLGFFVTESSEHFSEYVPWFIKGGREDLIKEFNIPLDEYIRRCENQLADWDALKLKLEDTSVSLEVKCSNEYAANIIVALEGGSPAWVNANIPNNFKGSELITNLPRECTVEVPCYLTGKGIDAMQVGKLPSHLAALMRTNINVQEMAVEAAVTLQKDYLYYAAMLDPHTGSELALDDIYAMVDELLAAHHDYLPRYG